jgi:hypothetical protein
MAAKKYKTTNTIDKVKAFILGFFKAETEALYKKGFPNLLAYNEALQHMNSFCVEALHNTFGLVPEDSLEEEEYYKKWAKNKYPNPRHLFKISEHKNRIHGSVFLVYASHRDPYADLFEYYNCLFVAPIENEFKIVRLYRFTDDTDSSRGDKSWMPNEEYENKYNKITFKNAGKLIGSERYLEPVDCKYSMKDHKNEFNGIG